MDLRRIIRTPDGGQRATVFVVLVVAVPAAVLGLAAVGGWAGTLGIALIVVAGTAVMVRYGNS